MIGEVIGNYRVTKQIGSGGMGVVYEAVHQLLGKRAAVKVLLPERSVNTEIVERFFNEAKASSSIHHPGIVEIYDFGHLPTGNAYIIMELLDGETLAQRLKRERPLSASEAISIARHIAGILAATHRHGIIHRDLKPDNVFLVADPAMPRGERAKLLDFGIAKLAADELPSTVKTETGRLMGTPYYMSPEQCRGSGKVDHRSDIYALGCVLYQLLTGRPPFVLEGSGEVLAAHIHVPPLPPRSIERTVPLAVEKIVMTLLEKNPDKRYQTMDDVIAAFNGLSSLNTGEMDSEPSLAASTSKIPTASSISHDVLIESGTTTLGSSATESRANLHEHKKNWIVPLIVGGGLAALAAAAIIGITATENVEPRSDGDTAPAVASTEAVDLDTRADDSQAQPIVRPMAAQAPLPPQKVTLVIESEPDGVAVYRESDGVRLGETPLRYTITKVVGEAAFILKKKGYRDRTLTMSADKDDEFMVEMHKRDSKKRDRTAKTESKAESKAETKTETEVPGSKGSTNGTAVVQPKKTPPDKDGAIDPFNLVPKK